MCSGRALSRVDGIGGVEGRSRNGSDIDEGAGGGDGGCRSVSCAECKGRDEGVTDNQMVGLLLSNQTPKEL